MARQGTWTTRGFDAFRRGHFGNGGRNLYVSRAGANRPRVTAVLVEYG